MRNKVGHSSTVLFEYNAVVSALSKRETSEKLSDISDIDNNLRIPQISSSKLIRQKLALSAYSEPSCVKIWEKKIGVTLSPSMWSAAFLSTKEERLRLLQWKIIHRIYPTSILLNKMGLKDSTSCAHCKETDSIEHFFFHCKTIKRVWNSCQNMIFKETNKQIKLTLNDILFGHKTENIKDKTIKIINHLIMITKMSISKFKYGNQINIDIILDREARLRLEERP
jgi:hypothetical protein